MHTCNTYVLRVRKNITYMHTYILTWSRTEQLKVLKRVVLRKAQEYYTETNILKEFLYCLEAKNLNLTRLVSITTDGAPSVVGKNKVVVSLPHKHMENNVINTKLITAL